MDDDRAVLLGLVAAAVLGSAGLVTIRRRAAPAESSRERDLAPALVATVLGGLLVALHLFTWGIVLMAMRTVARDPGLWGGSSHGMHWVSTWDHVRSTGATALALVGLVWT